MEGGHAHNSWEEAGAALGALVEVQIPNVFTTLNALDVALDPADVGLFGTDGIVLETDSLTDLVEQFLGALLLRRLPPQSLQRGISNA